MNGIIVSPKHGVNPSLERCFICGQETGAIVLLGKLKGDVQAEWFTTLRGSTCDQCKGVMDAGGIMLIEVRDGESGREPYRTGRVWGMSKQWKERSGQTGPISYVEESVALAIGLPDPQPKSGSVLP